MTLPPSPRTTAITAAAGLVALLGAGCSTSATSTQTSASPSAVDGSKSAGVDGTMVTLTNNYPGSLQMQSMTSDTSYWTTPVTLAEGQSNSVSAPHHSTLDQSEVNELITLPGPIYIKLGATNPVFADEYFYGCTRATEIQDTCAPNTEQQKRIYAGLDATIELQSSGQTVVLNIHRNSDQDNLKQWTVSID